jgi:RNA polymerase sigma-70 factor (ECF subfamily)
LGDHDEAYDVAQEVFLTCFRKIHQFRGEARFWSWLCRIVDNHVINHRGWQERRGRSKTFSLDQPPSADPDAVRGWDPPDPSADPRREAQDHEAMAALDRNLGELGADHREILLLRFADGLSYEEIAEHLQISLGTVKSRINRARAELRARMKDHLDSTEA